MFFIWKNSTSENETLQFNLDTTKLIKLFIKMQRILILFVLGYSNVNANLQLNGNYHFLFFYFTINYRYP